MLRRAGGLARPAPAGRGGLLGFGHEPVSPVAERLGDTVRLTADAEQGDSPVIELHASGSRRLLTGAERGLTDFLTLANAWPCGYLPGHQAPATAALARARGLPGPAGGGAGPHVR